MEFKDKRIMEIKKIQFEWNENCPIFASENYLKSKNYEYGWLGGFSDNSLKFVLPYLIKKRLIFKYLQFQTGTIYIDNNMSIENEKFFLNNVIGFLKQKNLDFISHSPTNTVFNTFPDNSEYAEFGSYIIDLMLSEDDLWKNIHQKHRNVIRKAMKSNVIIEKDRKLAETAYQILKQTMERADKIFILKKEFDSMITLLEDNTEIFIVSYENKPQGCAIIPFSQYSAYYLLGGSIEKPFTGSLNLLQWEIIKYYKEKGVRCYDFAGARIKPEQGSKLEGIQRFKSRFGTNMKKGYLWKFPFNKFKYNLFKKLVFIRNKEGDIVDQEKKLLNNW